MGRHLSRELSEVGWRVYDRMRELGIEPLQVAAAAGLSPSTLYRVMRADGSRTSEPRLHTKRRIARALKTTINALFDDEQLEFVEEARGKTDNLGLFSGLVLHHLRTVPREIRQDASRAAAVALVDWILTSVDVPAEDMGEYGIPAPSDLTEGLLLLLLQRLPKDRRRSGTKAAIEAMLQVEAVSNQVYPSEEMYRAIGRTNWSEKRLARNIPPLERAPRY